MSEPVPPSAGARDAAAGSEAAESDESTARSADAATVASDQTVTDSVGVRPTPPSYEAARAELADVMRALESGGQSLEESLELWKRGEELADLCQRWLDAASARLDDAIAAREEHSAERRQSPAS